MKQSLEQQLQSQMSMGEGNKQLTTALSESQNKIIDLNNKLLMLDGLRQELAVSFPFDGEEIQLF